MKKKPVVADVTQTFYDSIASQYEKFYPDWQTATHEEAAFLRGIKAIMREAIWGEL